MPTKGSVIMVDIEIRLDNKDTENWNRVLKIHKSEQEGEFPTRVP